MEVYEGMDENECEDDLSHLSTSRMLGADPRMVAYASSQRDALDDADRAIRAKCGDKAEFKNRFAEHVDPVRKQLLQRPHLENECTELAQKIREQKSTSTTADDVELADIVTREFDEGEYPDIHEVEVQFFGGDEHNAILNDEQQLFAYETLQWVHRATSRSVKARNQFLDDTKKRIGDSEAAHPSRWDSPVDRYFKLLHGGPGVGKSHVTKQVVKAVRAYAGERSVLVSATTGAAAVNIRGATYHSHLGINPKKDASDKLPERTKARIRDLFSGVFLWVIDEVSMMDCFSLAVLDMRLRTVMENSLPFGGIGVMLVGDLVQIEAVQSSCLLFEEPIKKKRLAHCHEQRQRMILDGYQLFKGVRVFHLVKQMRAAKDRQQQECIKRARNPYEKVPPFNAQYLRSISEYSGTNESDVDWLFAPVVVASNIERESINLYKSALWADLHDEDVHDIPCIYPGSRQQHVPSKYTVIRPSQRFVAGAPAMLVENVCIKLGLANGTPITLIDYVGNSDESDDFVIVEVPSNHRESWGGTGEDWVQNLGKYSLFPGSGRFIIPLRRQRLELDKGVPVYGFPFTLGFSLTFHKVQGQTLDKVVLDLNTRPLKTPGMNVSYSLLYVGLTRVRELSNLRVLPLSSQSVKDIAKLEMPTALRKWLQMTQR